jgi:hypothetical protein
MEKEKNEKRKKEATAAQKEIQVIWLFATEKK